MDRMVRETSTSSRVTPRRSSTFPRRPLEDRHRAVERAEAEGPLGGGVPPVVPEEDPRRRDPAAGEVPDLRGEVERPILSLDADPGHRQAGAELLRAPLPGRPGRARRCATAAGARPTAPGRARTGRRPARRA